MNVTLETKPLAEAVALLTGMQARHLNSSMLSLGYMLMSSTATGAVALSVTDLDLSGRITLRNRREPAASDDSDSIAVPLLIIGAQIRHMATLSDMVDLRSTENLRLRLKTKQTQAHINGIDPNDFPVLPWSVPSPPDLELTAKDLYSLLHATLPSVDTSQHNVSALTGVNLTACGRIVQAASTDQHRMTYASVPGEKRESALTFFLPKALVQHTLRLCSKLADDDRVGITRGRDCSLIFVSAGDSILASREIGSKHFPDLGRWLAMSGDRRVVVSIAEMEAVLSAAMPFAANSETDIPRVELVLEGSQLQLYCRNHSAGEFEAELPAQVVDVDPFRFSMNASFLRDFMASIKDVTPDLAITPPATPEAAIQFHPAGVLPDGQFEVRGWCTGMM